MDLLVIYSNQSDPILNALAERYQKGRVFTISVEELLNEATIFDEIREGIPQICWIRKNGEMIKNSDEMVLVNRVSSLSDYLFDGYIGSDKIYAKREFSAYLGFALSSFKHTLISTSPYGFATDGRSLIGQWEKLRSNDQDYHLPTYVLKIDSKPADPLETEISLIDNVPYGFGYWRVGRNPAASPYRLYVEKPEGDPVFVCSSGQELCVVPQNSKALISQITRNRLITAHEKAASLMNYFFAESLFFVNEDHLLLATINPSYHATRDHDDLPTMIVDGVTAFTEGI